MIRYLNTWFATKFLKNMKFIQYVEAVTKLGKRPAAAADAKQMFVAVTTDLLAHT
jgi:hypothetical protein